MARRGFWQDFASGWDSVGSIMDSVQAQRKKEDLAKVAKAEETPSYTAEQGQQLEAIANAKDEQGNPYYRLEPTEDGKSYRVVPNFQDSEGNAAPAATVGAQGSTFLGKTNDKPLDDNQREIMRQRGMAAVMDQYGDVEGGQRYRQQALQTQQMQKQGQLADLQIAQAQRAGVRDEKADQKTAALEAIDKTVGDAQAQRLTNADGTQRQATLDDQLAANQQRLSLLVQGGHMNEANALAQSTMQMTQQKIQTETAERNDALGKAVASGNLDDIKNFYNKYIPDGAVVTAVVKNKDGSVTVKRTGSDGKDVPDHTFKDMNEVIVGLNSLRDPEALYRYSQNEFKNDLDRKRLALEGQRVGIQGAEAASTIALNKEKLAQIQEVTAEKKELNQIRNDLGSALEAGDKQAEAMARQKLMAYSLSGKGGQNMSDTERKANFYLASGAAKTMAEAAQMAHEKVQTSPKDDFLKLTTSAMPLSGKDLETAMATLHGSDWKQKIQGTGGQPSQGVPKVGDVVNGFRFNGGNPRDKNAWSRVQ